MHGLDSPQVPAAQAVLVVGFGGLDEEAGEFAEENRLCASKIGV
jgi:hypothetical protein